jgi:hypothetical protein
MVKKRLDKYLPSLVFIVEDPDLNTNFVLKLITHVDSMVDKEERLWMSMGQECKNLILFLEIFEWNSFYCVRMEYLYEGNLESQVNLGIVFTQQA